MLKVGFIGAGGTGKAHSRIISKLEGVKVAGIADINLEAAKTLAAEFDAEPFQDYRKMLKRDIDAVFVCTPPYVHAEEIVNSARAGKHIFCEKPLTLTLKQADKILEEVSKAKVKLMVGYVLHFFPTFRKFKEIFASGQLGELVVCWLNRMGRSELRPGAWLSQPEKSGGMTVEFATHDVDWLRWIGGEVKQVYGKIFHTRPEIGIEDNVWAILTFNQGIGVMGASWSAYIGQHMMGIIGTDGMVVLDPAGNVKLKTKDKPEQTVEVEKGVDPYRAEDEHFIECIREDKEPLLSGLEARADLEVTLAIQKSSRLGRAINLPRK